MAKYLTDRQDRKLEEMARKLDGLSGRNNRLPSPSSQITGTDFGSIIVPRTTIPAATRTVQAGSDKFEPGEGTAYLFKRATGGEIEPRLDRDGAVIFRTVYNLSTQAYAPNNAAPTTDYIGPETDILFALMDRSAKLYIPADDEAMAAGLPVGAIVQSWLQPIVDTGKKYIDRDGAADTDWALMDGASNASPGSGIDLQDFFVRGAADDLNDADDTAAGRTLAGTPDDDEVRIQVAVDAHVDHIHQFNTDQCHGDVAPTDTHFDFSTNATQDTSIQKTVAGGSMTLSHTVITTLTNNQGGTIPAVEHIEMTPPHKKLHWFERVAD